MLTPLTLPLVPHRIPSRQLSHSNNSTPRTGTMRQYSHPPTFPRPHHSPPHPRPHNPLPNPIPHHTHPFLTLLRPRRNHAPLRNDLPERTRAIAKSPSIPAAQEVRARSAMLGRISRRPSRRLAILLERRQQGNEHGVCGGGDEWGGCGGRGYVDAGEGGDAREGGRGRQSVLREGMRCKLGWKVRERYYVERLSRPSISQNDLL